jgi:predicted DNA-binding transcriptional regulator YafY
VKSWVLSFGDMVEVLKPAKLRKEILESSRNMVRKYQ